MPISPQLPRDRTNVPIQVTRFGPTLTFTISATGSTFATAGTYSSVARIWSTIPAHIKFVNTATETGAAVTDAPIGAETPEYVGLSPGLVLSAALAGTGTATTGSIWITAAL